MSGLHAVPINQEKAQQVQHQGASGSFSGDGHPAPYLLLCLAVLIWERVRWKKPSCCLPSFSKDTDFILEVTHLLP